MVDTAIILHSLKKILNLDFFVLLFVDLNRIILSFHCSNREQFDGSAGLLDLQKLFQMGKIKV